LATWGRVQYLELITKIVDMSCVQRSEARQHSAWCRGSLQDSGLWHV